MDEDEICKIFASIIDRFREWGLKKSVIVIVLILGPPLFIISASKITISSKVIPFRTIGEPLNQEIKINVSRKAKMADGVSVNSIVEECIGEISDKAELISTFTELYQECDDLSTKNETIKVPENAGAVDYGIMKLYGWEKESQSLLSYIFGQDSKKDSESCIIMVMENQYIKINFSSKMSQLIFLNMEIECGEITGK